MAKLYPPNINGTIPAFYTNIAEGTTEIVVPFSMNRAVSIYEIWGLELKIKTLSGSVLGVVPSTVFDDANMTASFDVTSLNEKLLLGNYYKIQIAYVQKIEQIENGKIVSKEGEIGYYSTVGIIKYTAQPIISIQSLQESKVNLNRYEYVGTYKQDLDPTEKLYSSKFIIYDGDYPVYDTGDILHNNTNDEQRNESSEYIKLPLELTPDKVYTIQYSIETSNGLKVKTKRYKIVQRRSVDPSIKADLVATLDFNNGYIELTLDDKVDAIISGSFIISRSCNINNWRWERIKDFTLSSTPPAKFNFKDCTIEQGVIYKYSIQQYNEVNGIYSNRIISNLIEADFEDAFLYDGERQLRIRFNPKVSSFKATLQESKSDTIGYQYPFFTRNKHIYYKEFPISGLISYLMDDNELFIKKHELGIEILSLDSSLDDEGNPINYARNRKEERYNITTDLVSRNISAERFFKMNVLSWLNNGKPKSFRSPGEGNYIVRLMNVSLSPNDTLGRMLHTFSCTAYEIADYTLDNLGYYNIYDPISTDGIERRWATINVRDFVTGSDIDLTEVNAPDYITIISGKKMPEILLQDFLPGSKIRIDGEEIVIGSTGSYRAKNELNPFTKIEVNKSSYYEGLITYGYDAKISDSFSNIQNIIIEDIPCRQIIGNSYYSYQGENQLINNIFDYLQTVNSTILNISLLKVMKRPVLDGFIMSDKSLGEIRAILDNADKNTNAADLSFETSTGEIISLQKNTNYNRPYELPLYQLRLRRTDKREQHTVFDVINLAGEVDHFIYEEYKPYTFEQYYIDKNKDRFYPYTGFFFDPYTGEIFMASDDLFCFFIDNEKISVAELEEWETKNLSVKVKSIIFNQGVYGELSYSKQRTDYVFDGTFENGLTDTHLIELRQNYEDALATYLFALDGCPNNETPGFTSMALDYVEAYLPLAYNKLSLNMNCFNKNIYNISQDNISTYYNGLGSYPGIFTLKNIMQNNYKTYMIELEQVINNYKKEHGTE